MLLMPGGYKDGNEALQQGVENAELFCAVRAARGFDPEELKSPLDLLDEIVAEMFPERAGLPTGDELPWAMPMKLRDGEVTVVHGYNSHGKTVLLSFVLEWLAAKFGRRSLIASLEVPPRKLLRNILRQVFGRPRARDEVEARRWVQWEAQFFWVYAHVGEAKLDRVLEVWRYGARKYGIKYFLLDSLMCVAGLQGEDYDGQKDVMNQLLQFAIRENVHVFLVCHSKKPDARRPEGKHWPGKYDISGSGNISNLAWNVWCVWRNKEKEQQIGLANELQGGDPDREKILNEWLLREDAMLSVQKQRETGEEPFKRLYFDHGPESSWQYREVYGDAPGALIEAGV
jgi:twinkle protein